VGEAAGSSRVAAAHPVPLDQKAFGPWMKKKAKAAWGSLDDARHRVMAMVFKKIFYT